MVLHGSGSEFQTRDYVPQGQYTRSLLDRSVRDGQQVVPMRTQYDAIIEITRQTEGEFIDNLSQR